MGTVFQVPWTRIDPWPAGVDLLRGLGFTVAALALSDDAVTLDALVADGPQRLALVLGAEGDGLGPATSRPPTSWCGSRWPGGRLAQRRGGLGRGVLGDALACRRAERRDVPTPTGRPARPCW